MQKKIIISGLFLLIAIASYLFKDNGFYLYTFFSYLIYFISYIYVGRIAKANFYYYVSPIFLTQAYINISFAIGSLVQYFDLFFEPAFSIIFSDVDSIRQCFLYFTICNIALLLVTIVKFDLPLFKFAVKRTMFWLSLAVFVGLSLMDLGSINPLGGQGGIMNIPKSVAAITMFICASQRPKMTRVIIYLGVLLISALTQFDSKREIIFLFVAIAYIEYSIFAVFYRKRYLRYLLLALITCCCIVGLIISMSIYRGYGGYGEVSFIEAAGLVDDYLSRSESLSFVAKNLEFSTTYYHSHNALNMVMNDNDLVTYGSTIFRVLFLTIPSSIVEFKPASIIHEYTSQYDSFLRMEGRSIPINVYAEFFWNFFWLGPIFLAVVYYLLTLFYRKILINIRVKGSLSYFQFYLYFISFFLMYPRGSGLDLFVLYLLIAFLVIRLTHFCMTFPYYRVQYMLKN